MAKIEKKKPIKEIKKPQKPVDKKPIKVLKEPEPVVATVLLVDKKTKSPTSGIVGVSHVLIEVVGDFKVGDQLKLG